MGLKRSLKRYPSSNYSSHSQVPNLLPVATLVPCLKLYASSHLQEHHSITRKQRNKAAHTRTGNRQPHGPSLQLAYWNKGPSHLVNKQLDIDSIMASYKPDILGIGEANFKRGQDINEAKQEGFTLHKRAGPGQPWGV